MKTKSVTTHFPLRGLGLAVAMASCGPFHATAQASNAIEEVIVSSQFRDVSLLKLANSASVLTDDEILARGASNLDQLLAMAPNVNFSAGASRGRFIQIRGIGERSQFIDPVNPSVGLIVDGVDFTGLGLAASTLDVEQVEILRGPQGTLYGANALAGLVNIRSHNPTDQAIARITAEVAEYDSYTVAAVVSGPLSEKAGYRLAMQNQQSDGYMDNRFLDRDDTNNIDETVVRGKLLVDASSELQLGFSAIYIDVDNGYDAFSFNNDRHTLSDQPGWDRQQTLGGAITSSWSGHKAFNVETVVSWADSDTEYGYDEDWSYVGIAPGWEYSSTDNYERERDNLSADVRLISSPGDEGESSWVAGFYHRVEDEELLRNNSFRSSFETENSALYGQLRTPLQASVDLVFGLRYEHRNADYRDSLGVNSGNDEDLWGGHITLEYHYSDNTLLYALLSRGYKAGGVNGKIISASATNPAIGSDAFSFDTEYMLNYELGLKGRWLDNRLQGQLALFYQDRKDVQAKQSVFDPADFSFDDFLANAAGGSSLGLELDVKFQATESTRLFASVGLMDAEFRDFTSSSHVDARDDNLGLQLAPVDLDGRDVAHAPNYQFFVGSEFALSQQLTLRIEVEGKDEFYFSNSHNKRSTSYELLNARLTYQQADWTLSLWGRNLTDKDYETRGFYFSNQFGNNPVNFYAPEAYHQLGEPKVVGVTASYTF